ncbi:MAG: hypothetical protein HUJ71_07180 [Pseudobutyrivibrio sp.]|nr:hypothetical protein [Pseudobutyrivibrio sp.]
MNRILICAVGISFVIVSLTVPFPNLLGISGIIWRILIGLAGGIFFAVNIRKQ